MAPFRQPKKSSGRVASVLGATMTEDIGQPSEKHSPNDAEDLGVAVAGHGDQLRRAAQVLVEGHVADGVPVHLDQLRELELLHGCSILLECFECLLLPFRPLCFPTLELLFFLLLPLSPAMAPAAQQQQKMASEAATQRRMATTMTAHQYQARPPPPPSASSGSKARWKLKEELMSEEDDDHRLQQLSTTTTKGPKFAPLPPSYHRRHFSPMQVQPQQRQIISGRQQTSRVSSAISSQNHQYSHTSPFGLHRNDEQKGERDHQKEKKQKWALPYLPLPLPHFLRLWLLPLLALRPAAAMPQPQQKQINSGKQTKAQQKTTTQSTQNHQTV
ncbi:hypothetical protein TYRP_009529 [Tyrophagus putrescentiae]|nr:hypothetical protein TYRP_009529 [Tyrophagus putrescentiae]